MSEADVVVAGGGPAGAWTAFLLARAGARVVVCDRSRFPRPKLCGDTLNPGALALLGRRLDLAPLVSRARRLDGMLLSGPGPVLVRGEYGGGLQALSVRRSVLDAWLIEQAVASGARLLEETVVTAPVHDARGVVTGVRVRSAGGAAEAIVRARLTIAADGRRSRLGTACGLSASAARPRRWAIGAYFDEVSGLSGLGEMHVRPGYYLGVAPTADGAANACLVQPYARDGAWRRPDLLLSARLHADPLLGPRFVHARPASGVTVLGPLATESRRPAAPGIWLVGDAAGFVDPMTGDGIRLALTSAEAAAAVAVDLLAGRYAADDAARAYARLLARRVGRKRAFNRAMRALVASPQAVAFAARGARVWPGVLRAAIRYAGDARAGSLA